MIIMCVFVYLSTINNFYILYKFLHKHTHTLADTQTLIHTHTNTHV